MGGMGGMDRRSSRKHPRVGNPCSYRYPTRICSFLAKTLRGTSGCREILNGRHGQTALLCILTLDVLGVLRGATSSLTPRSPRPDAHGCANAAERRDAREAPVETPNPLLLQNSDPRCTPCSPWRYLRKFVRALREPARVSTRRTPSRPAPTAECRTRSAAHRLASRATSRGAAWAPAQGSGRLRAPDRPAGRCACAVA